MSKYLKIDWKSGLLAETSKEEREGFEPYNLTNGETRYKKLYRKGIIATLKSVELKSSNFGMQLVLSFKDYKEWLNLQIPVLDQRDQVTEYAIAVGILLPNLKNGQVYRVFPYLIEKDGEKNKYDKRGISFKLNDADGEKVTPALTWKEGAKDGTSIPRLVWKEDKMTGRKKPTAASVEAQRDFFAALFEKEIERINGEAAPSTPSSSSESLKPETPEDDELPF